MKDKENKLMMIDSRFCITPKNVQTLATHLKSTIEADIIEVFESFHWKVGEGAHGELEGIEYTGDKTTFEKDISLLKDIGPFVEEYSFVDLIDVNGEVIVLSFQTGHLQVITGKVELNDDKDNPLERLNKILTNDIKLDDRYKFTFEVFKNVASNIIKNKYNEIESLDKENVSKILGECYEIFHNFEDFIYEEHTG